MRAQESMEPCKHLPLILPGGPTSGEHARGPPESGRKREEVGGGGEEEGELWRERGRKGSGRLTKGDGARRDSERPSSPWTIKERGEAWGRPK